ncbi:acyltransferase family protein [Reichenbachiella versicolor]|uniref:acyltransferase family protein n=1 Tax=Reichenbachiella versicolor TaxID=1821036 RepID=UPI000D6E27D3|nr:acyltransferase [Reichenbachiella versicolor]
MQKSYLHNLTSLRGIAAILVATLHFHFFLGGILPAKNSAIVDKFYLMVDLFFILSGFIMCYVYEDKFKEEVLNRDYKRFLTARLARIYPLHLLSLTGELLIFVFLTFSGLFQTLHPTAKHLYRLETIPIQLTFLQTIGIYNFDTWNAPAWSLSAEWWAYVLFPFMFLLTTKLGYQKWFLAAGIAIAGWVTIEFVLAPMEPFMNKPPNPAHKTLDVNWHYGTLRGIVGFIGGMSLWQLFRLSKLKSWFGNGWALLIIALGCALSMHFKWYDSLTVVLIGLLILSSAYGSQSIDKFYSFGALVKLGKWSFSIYMWHMILIHLVKLYFHIEKGTPVWRPLQSDNYYKANIMLLTFLLITSLIGYLSYKFIEVPTRQWIRRKWS